MNITPLFPTPIGKVYNFITEKERLRLLESIKKRKHVKHGAIIGDGSMTGGLAFLLDEDNRAEKLINKEIVDVIELSTSAQEDILKPTIQSHAIQTKSPKAEKILSNWHEFKNKFKVIVPPSERLKAGLIEEKVLIQ